MPARSSIAAAVEPARPPPMIATSVYCMLRLFEAISLRRKTPTNVEGTGAISGDCGHLTEMQCHGATIARHAPPRRHLSDGFGNHLFTRLGNRRAVVRPRQTCAV